MDFGATGDGNADDSPAIQRAVSSIEATGGVVWFPPGNVYAMASEVTIRSKFPIWLKSYMGNKALPGAVGLTDATHAVIRPKNSLTYMFSWKRAVGATDFVQTSGGGIEGLSIADWIGTSQARNFAIQAAINIDEASYFSIRDTIIQWIKGSALRVGSCVVVTVDGNCHWNSCGDAGTSRPVIELHGGVVGVAFMWAYNLFLEASQYVGITLTAAGLLHGHALYFENSSSSTYLFIDSTVGLVRLDRCQFNSTGTTSVIIGATPVGNVGPRITNCLFNNTPGANSTLKILASAQLTVVENCAFKSISQTGPSIELLSNWCTISGIFIYAAGRIIVGGIHNKISDIFMHWPLAAAGQACIDFTSQQCDLNNVHIDGLNLTAGHGIRLSLTTVRNCTVCRLASGANGIVASAFGIHDVIQNCNVYELVNGTPIVYTQGNIANGNRGYPSSATAVTLNTVVATATLHAESGTITTPNLTGIVGAVYNVDITNSLINANSRVFASITRGTENASFKYTIEEVLVYTGGFWVSFKNTGPVAWNGNVRVHFFVVNSGT